MKTWRSIALAMELYPTHCIHIDTDLNGGVAVRWAYNGDEAGTHVERWKLNVTGRLKSFMGKIIVLQVGNQQDAETDLLRWDIHHYFINNAKYLIEKHLEINQRFNIYWDYNKESIFYSTSKKFTLAD